MTASPAPAREPSPPAAQGWLSVALRASGFILAIAPFLPPLLRLKGLDRLADPLDQVWEGACHRMPERSLSISGELMPLCSRCLGLVEGLGLGLLVAWPYRDVRTLRITLSLTLAFLFLELTTQDLGWHPVFHPTRLLSGFLVAFPVGAAASALARRIAHTQPEGHPAQHNA